MKRKYWMVALLVLIFNSGIFGGIVLNANIDLSHYSSRVCEENLRRMRLEFPHTQLDFWCDELVFERLNIYRLSNEGAINELGEQGAILHNWARYAQFMNPNAAERAFYQLKELGADLEVRDAFGKTPLDLLFDTGMFRYMPLLLDNGVSLENQFVSIFAHGFTPRDRAWDEFYYDLLLIALRSQSVPFFEKHLGVRENLMTSVLSHYLAIKHRVAEEESYRPFFERINEVMKGYLIWALNNQLSSLDLNDPMDGLMPLTIAVAFNELEWAEILLDHGASPCADCSDKVRLRNDLIRTPLDYARLKGEGGEEMVDLLESYLPQNGND